MSTVTSPERADAVAEETTTVSSNRVDPDHPAHQDAASESSDNGLRMTPAEARRFARRNLRRASATPDLVNSLVRPPSPEALYVTPEVHDRLRLGAYRRIGRQNSSSSAQSTLENRRSGPLMPPHQASLDIPSKYGGRRVFDIYSLNYVTDVDTNLLCPICHDPLVDPVTTPCDHTFCYRCIRRSIASSPSGTTCPIDREPLIWSECFSAARLIRTQLNSLIVTCPFSPRGCTKELRREVIEKHATTECQYREFLCPDEECTKKLSFKPTDDVCRHREIDCTLCDEKIEETESEQHLLSCSESKTRCEQCWELVTRSQLETHSQVECSEVEVGCMYQDFGCPARVLRGHMRTHTLYCAFHPDTPSGIVIRTQKELIQSYNDLGNQIRDIAGRQVDNNKQIEDLKTLLSKRPSGDSAVGDSRTMQDLDAGFEEVHQNLTHLEARQSMWTLNQVMPIREEVTELRNNINMVRMHVNWLLNRSREEGRSRAAATTAGAAGPLRRDSSSGGGLMLPERRRSSGAEADLPRL